MKTKDLRTMSDSDIDKAIQEHTSLLDDLQYNHRVSRIENPTRMRTIRRDIARMKTILCERVLNAKSS